MNSLEDLEKKINSELTTKINNTEIKHNQIYIEIDKDDIIDSTTSYTFTVTVSDQYQSAATSKEFTVNVDVPFTTTEYGDMTGQSTSFIDQNIFYNISQDADINSPEYIFRPEDPNFGMKEKPEK